MREKVIEILKSVNDLIDCESDALIDDEVIDSIELMEVISELEDEFEIEIDMENIVPQNFNSVDAIVEMIQNLTND